MKAIYDFNQIRNQFKFSEKLEIEMWEEEKREFYDATTLAERVDAYCDCRYVSIGTSMKMDANGIRVCPYNSDVYMLEEIIREEIDGANYGNNGGTMTSCYGGKTDVILRKAMKIVCDANALKLNQLNKDGKVEKQADLPNATELIAKMIEKVLNEDS